MINWRKGLGGTVGGIKTAIRGVFTASYSITTITPVPPLNYPLENNVTLAGPDTLQGKLTARDGLSGPGLTGSGILNGPNIRR